MSDVDPMIEVHVRDEGADFCITFTALTEEDITAIDAAGKKGARQQTARTFIRRAVLACAVASVGLGLAGTMGIHIL